MPRNRRRWRRYISQPEVTIDPQGRRRRSLSGASSLQLVREASQMSSSAITARAISTGQGSRTNEVSRSDPAATAPQKKSVAVVPTDPPSGTVKLESRQVSSAQVIGATHCGFRFGPVGPL